MKVAIITSFMDGRRTGVGNYTYNLVKGLQKIGKGNDLLLVHSEESDEDVYRLAAEVIVKSSPRWLNNMFTLPNALSKLECDLVHFPAFTGSQQRAYQKVKVPIVLTVHDLTPILFPEAHPTKSALFWGKAFKAIVKHVTHWIAVSGNTKADLVKIFDIDPQNVTVVYEAADDIYKPYPDKQDLKGLIRRKYGIEKPFILYTGTLEPRKNIPTLLRAFAELKRKGFQHELVLIGGKGWKYEEIFETIHQLGMNDQVIVPGYVPKEDLVAFYNAAEVFVYPSLYEGFGLPPLEAMACGTPVVVSNTSSLPEVVGDAGLLVDPLNVDGLTGAIEKLLVDEDLRQNLSKKALEKAGHFSWEGTAFRTWELYETLAG